MHLKAVHHIQVTYPLEVEEAMEFFYSQVLELKKIHRPEELNYDSGFWYELGDVQIHLSPDRNVSNQGSRRHICYQVDSLPAFEEHLKGHGVEIIPDKRPIPGYVRFFLRDPGDNRIEITQIKT
ncbi:bleomycin resistance protein [Sphaerospermopsis aphanizomenoides BCCUSP55]|uniref:VOC family protein n=1 Tax=Sphaerospermopsis aphanizomenoides TaxID=459663 RepID=UPI001904B86F|nr:VOC family protein [Sphaerospermopsis aphanizomenoides]MBK1988925.1 bleomycin resistance protein [Sphaerospermopsis aphanizomenoides BCCUSP55]